MQATARTYTAIPSSVERNVSHIVSRLVEIERVLNDHSRVYGERSHGLSVALDKVRPIIAAYQAKLEGGQRVADGKGLGQAFRALVAQAPTFENFGLVSAQVAQTAPTHDERYKAAGYTHVVRYKAWAPICGMWVDSSYRTTADAVELHRAAMTARQAAGKIRNLEILPL